MNSFQKYIKIKSHLYLHCPSCDGLSLSGSLENRDRPANCVYCGSKFNRVTSNSDNITRFVAVVEKEESMQEALTLLQRYKKGVNRKELERILDSKGCLMKYIHQLIGIGLIRKTKLSYYLTEKGSKILEACNKD